MSQTSTKGLKKRERTKLALLESAISVIAKKGMAETKITDITDQAGMANGTFYNYFDDRTDILREVAYSVAGEMGRQIDNDMVGIEDAVLRVATATTRFILAATSAPDWGAVLIGSVEYLPDVREDALQYLIGDLERGVTQGRFDIEVTSFLLNQIAALISISIRLQLTSGPDEKLTAQTCENVLRLCGLTPAVARRAVARVRLVHKDDALA